MSLKEENRLNASGLTSVTFEVMSPMLPIWMTATIGTAISAANISKPWTMSVRDAPRKPPNRV
ncbi:hypothetical protein D3C81_2341340 [compost metagenome]